MNAYGNLSQTKTTEMVHLLKKERQMLNMQGQGKRKGEVQAKMDRQNQADHDTMPRQTTCHNAGTFQAGITEGTF